MTAIVIGAGASGLACAIQLKLNIPDIEVIVLERMSSPGKKILATGNGRCNITNTKSEYYDEILSFLNNNGIITRHDDEGRVYPYSLKAETILSMLLKQCENLGVEIITDCEVTNIDNDLIVTTDSGMYMADYVIVCTGGKAQEKLGSNGSGYSLLSNFGHSVTNLYPSLVQLTSSSKYPRAISGTRTKCNITIELDGVSCACEFGEILFTDYGLSGIATMNVSNVVAKNFSSNNPKKCHATLDLIPEYTIDEIKNYLVKFGNLDGILGTKLSSIISKQANDDINIIANIAKSWKLIITGTKGFEFAQITGGGIPLEETNNFESKYVKNLYICGEVLDVQFPCGGFNLSFAIHSGISVANQIKEKYND